MKRLWTLVARLDVDAPTGANPAVFGSHSLRNVANHLRRGWLNRATAPATAMYHVADRLHDGRMADVPGHEIAPTVSAWLAELGAQSPMVDDLARAVRAGDWSAAYAVGDYLSVEVTLATAA